MRAAPAAGGGRLLLLAATAALAPATAAAQVPERSAASDTLVEVRLAGGSTLFGRVVEERGDALVFETLSGERLEAPRQSVRVRPARGRIVRGELWHEDPGGTRLFLAPTARTLRQGAAYAGATWILPSAGYGATDDLTLAAGLPGVVAAKVRGLDRPRVQLAAGASTFRWLAAREPGCVRNCDAPPVVWHGIVYGVGTFGGGDDALHAGTGVHWGDGGTEVPVMLGGERRISRRLKLLTENWIIPGRSGAASAGVRRVGDRWALDYGVAAAFRPGGRAVQLAPVLSYSCAFGGGR